MSFVVLSAVVLAAAVLNVDAESLQFKDPPSTSWWPSHYSYGSAIVRGQNEKVLLWETETTRGVLEATSLLTVVNHPHTEVWKALRELVAEKIGIRNEYDSAAGRIPKPESHRLPYIGAEVGWWPEVGPGLSHLGKGLSFPVPREYELTSQPYNQLESIKGFSEVRIRVVEGKGLLGNDVTIIELRRRDYCNEWAMLGRSAHIAIPLPYKEDRAFTLVTTTEVKLFEALKTRIPALVIRYFVPSPTSIEFSDQYRATVLTKMKEATQQF